VRSFITGKGQTPLRYRVADQVAHLDADLRVRGLALLSVKGSLKLWALVSVVSEWFTEM